MKIEINEQLNIPLQQQIVNRIKSKILSGELLADYQLPSIRLFAKDNRISVITVQKAYEILENDGLIYSKMKKGFFVKNLDNLEKKSISLMNLKKSLEPILKKSLSEGLSKDEIISQFNDILNEIKVNYEK